MDQLFCQGIWRNHALLWWTLSCLTLAYRFSWFLLPYWHGVCLWSCLVFRLSCHSSFHKAIVALFSLLLNVESGIFGRSVQVVWDCPCFGLPFWPCHLPYHLVFFPFLYLLLFSLYFFQFLIVLTAWPGGKSQPFLTEKWKSVANELGELTSRILG